MLHLEEINNTWSLFLDRDGVINVDKSPYTLNADMFEFYPGVPEAIAAMSGLFRYIFVTTNQRGVGRQLMTEHDLQLIHEKMLSGLRSAGGRIDAIYYCTAIDNSHPDRKPNPGMALRAFREHPQAVASQSLIVGNNISDMEFGRNAGIHTVLVHTTGTHVNMPHPLVDVQFASLPGFADALIRSRR